MKTAPRRFSGARIVELRNRAGLTQADLAQRARIHEAQLSRVETGKTPNPGAQLLGIIAGALDCEVSDFYVAGGAADAADEDDEESDLLAAAHELDRLGSYRIADRLRARARDAARARSRV